MFLPSVVTSWENPYKVTRRFAKCLATESTATVEIGTAWNHLVNLLMHVSKWVYPRDLVKNDPYERDPRKPHV